MVVLPTNIKEWYLENKDQFSPPICNKLLHKGESTVMFVGGPNERTDFHIEQGSEFFYMLKGSMKLPTIQKDKLVVVKIEEGEVFLLPPRVPHSPQRPETDSLGLVIERKRAFNELECLRWYVDFYKCKEILYEKYFICNDLAKDLVPVVESYKASSEFKSRKPLKNYSTETVPFKQNSTVTVPNPFSLDKFIVQHKERIASGEKVCLFPNHPCPEIEATLIGGLNTFKFERSLKAETVLYNLSGSMLVKVGEVSVKHKSGTMSVVGYGREFSVSCESESVVLVIRQESSFKSASL